VGKIHQRDGFLGLSKGTLTSFLDDHVASIQNEYKLSILPRVITISSSWETSSKSIIFLGRMYTMWMRKLFNWEVDEREVKRNCFILEGRKSGSRFKVQTSSSLQ